MVDIQPPAPEPAPVPPPYQPPTPGENPYDFITNPTVPQTGPPKKQRIIIVVVLFLVLLVVGLVVATLLKSSGGGPKDEYTKVLQQQTQLIHVSSTGEKTASSSTTKNLAITARLSLTNTQADLTRLAKKTGAASSEGPPLTAYSTSEIDKKLADAELNNRFDEEFTSTMQDLLTAYQTTLKKIYDQTGDSNDKKTLQQAYNNAQQLIGDNQKEDTQKKEDEKKTDTTTENKTP